MKKLPLLIALLVLTAGVTFILLKGKPEPEHSLFDTLYSGQPVTLTIKTDLSALLKSKEEDDYQLAVFDFGKTTGESRWLDGKVKARGVYRKELCTFPPLKLRVEDETLRKNGLKEHKTLKLVTHCDAGTVFDQLVYKEYLAFKLYNLLTERSFRVQLAHVRYEDANNKVPPIERPGFLIENENEMAARLGGKIWNDDYGPIKGVDKAQYKVFTVFQFMVGNTDWSLSNFHNSVVVLPDNKKEAVAMPFPVPYDFDFCGLVDAPYAVPHYSIPVKDVKERFFQWRGNQDEDFKETFSLFAKNKDAILNACLEFEALSEQCRVEALNYLDSFFELLETPEQIVGRG